MNAVTDLLLGSAAKKPAPGSAEDATARNKVQSEYDESAKSYTAMLKNTGTNDKAALDKAHQRLMDATFALRNYH